MELDADNHLLQALVQGKDIDLEQWPNLLSRLVIRLEKIILYEFPHPYKLPVSASGKRSPRACLGDSQNDSTLSTENTTGNSSIPDFPPILRTLISSINNTLFKYFSKAPPHTIQRLAELILFPHHNYRKLSSYLHAVDRVVHVTSPSIFFPLLLTTPNPSANNTSYNVETADGADLQPAPRGYGVSNNSLLHSAGSDEALGGAILTPISWLRRSHSSSPLEGEVVTQRSTEIIEGPNGPGGVETVSVSINGVSSATTIPNASSDEVSSSLI